MPLPPYIAAIRSKVGHDLLFLPSVNALVFNAAGEILLHRATHDGNWYTPGGLIDPGEQPADAIAREVLEETGLIVEPTQIISVDTEPAMQYANGDRGQYLTVCFACELRGGALTIGDDESLEVAFVSLDRLPELKPFQLARIRLAADGHKGCFTRNPTAGGSSTA